MRRCWALFMLCLSCAVATAAEDASSPPSQVSERQITDDERSHWAYQPIGHFDPPESIDPRWNRNPVDRFIKASLDAGGVEPLPSVGKAALLRRVYFDLIGLPPPPDAVEQFLRDDRPDAYEQVVDRLLAMPEHGERYAQHWLDLARFAETDGFEHDLVRPNAWRYRDWVIDALNRDLPFDQFVRLQLAGDEVQPGDPQASIATGFLLCGPDMPDINLQDERRHLVLNELTSTVGSVLLGLQVGCAQCHDHKFDAITLHDFYRLRAFFESADVFREHPIPTVAEQAARDAAAAAWTAEDRQGERRRRELEDLGRRRFREQNPDERPDLARVLQELDGAERSEHEELAKRIDALPKLPELPRGRVFRAGEPRRGRLCLRGDFRRQGEELEPGVPQVLLTAATKTCGHNRSVPATRAELVDWLMTDEHPLTARVIANRLWQWHFGQGLCGSPSDFGVMGEMPTHPELLDWLARELIRGRWSFKRMHRLLVTSETYQLASSAFDHDWSADERARAGQLWHKALAADPENTLLWRRRSSRLEGEAIRDYLLVISGQLSARRGGPGVRPALPPEVTSTLLRDQWQVSPDREDHRRRSVYLFVRRNLRYPLFDVFDRPDTNASCPMRHESTTATQSLVLMNSEFSLDCARKLAGILLRQESADGAKEIDAAYLAVVGRHPRDSERAAAGEFLLRQQALLKAEQRDEARLALPTPAIDSTTGDDRYRQAAFVDLCLALFNASEFIYVD